jgi:cytochrome c-type biogenesis protein CcmE
MKPRHKKFALIVTIVIGLSVAALFVLNAFKSNLVFFHSPSDVYAGKVPVNKMFRLGGMVEKGSVKKSKNSLRVDFIITDFKQSIPVHYRGILPDLFSEGQGVIAQGKLQDGKTFIADEVLAKHDENYMPPEVADILKDNRKTDSKPE